MSYLRRLTSGMVARFDELAARVENHEVLADAMLSELQAATAHAQSRYAAVKRDGEALQRALREQQQATAQWRERARRSTQDEARALECLRRSKQAEQRAHELTQRSAAHERAERDLGKDVELLVERLDAARAQRNLMRTRQARAEALASVQTCGDALGHELSAVFERWETRVTEVEFAGRCTADSGDALAQELASEEELLALRTELETLRAQGGEHV